MAYQQNKTVAILFKCKKKIHNLLNKYVAYSLLLLFFDNLKINHAYQCASFHTRVSFPSRIYTNVRVTYAWRLELKDLLKLGTPAHLFKETFKNIQSIHQGDELPINSIPWSGMESKKQVLGDVLLSVLQAQSCTGQGDPDKNTIAALLSAEVILQWVEFCP